MTRDAGHTPLDDLPRLTVFEPDRARAERTRRRCHAVLERHRRHSVPAAAKARTARSRLRPAVLAAFCVVYVAYVGELVATALRLLAP